MNKQVSRQKAVARAYGKGYWAGRKYNSLKKPNKGEAMVNNLTAEVVRQRKELSVRESGFMESVSKGLDNFLSSPFGE